MAEISYRRHRFPPVIIQHAVWLYLRFTLSYRDVEELLAERGLDISYETIRCWVLKFGPIIARRLRRCRPRPSNRWHLDEMVVRIAGERMYLWRAVDHEGEVLDMLVQRRRDSRAALRIAPLVRCLGSEDPECRARDEMALKIEGIVDGSVHAEKTLCGASRFEPLHFALPSSHRSRPCDRASNLGPICYPQVKLTMRRQMSRAERRALVERENAALPIVCD